MSLLWFLMIGLLAGWLASRIMKGPELSLAGNLVLGVIGSVVGGTLVMLLGFRLVGRVEMLVSATLGAMLLIWGVGKLRRR